MEPETWNRAEHRLTIGGIGIKLAALTIRESYCIIFHMHGFTYPNRPSFRRSDVAGPKY